MSGAIEQYLKEKLAAREKTRKMRFTSFKERDLLKKVFADSEL